MVNQSIRGSRRKYKCSLGPEKERHNSSNSQASQRQNPSTSASRRRQHLRRMQGPKRKTHPSQSRQGGGFVCTNQATRTAEPSTGHLANPTKFAGLSKGYPISIPPRPHGSCFDRIICWNKTSDFWRETKTRKRSSHQLLNVPPTRRSIQGPEDQEATRR